MAKTYNSLYPLVYDFQSLHAAYLRARRGKRQTAEVQGFELDLEGNLIALQNELIWGSYKTGTYRLFTVHEPKERQIAALPFRDRVLQHSLVAALEPIWERRFIPDSYACRVGRGTHAGADRAQAMLRIVKRRRGRVCVFKGDIAKYFANIDHDILKRLLRKRIRCRRTLILIDEIIDSTVRDRDAARVGLPIGNLTSQLFANIYLHELDCFVKHALHERYYLRYMDDWIIVHHDKAHLREVRSAVEAFLWDHLRLRTNAKAQVFPVAVDHGRALDFLGYRTWCTHRRVRKSSICRITHTLKRLGRGYLSGACDAACIRQSLRSWLAHVRHADSYGLRRKILSCAYAILNAHD